MYTQKFYPHLHISTLFLGLVLQTCGQPNQELGNIETPSTTERPMTTTHRGLSSSYGPFVTASGALVTLQQKEDVWTAKVQETAPLVREQQLNVGCAGDIPTILSQWQDQPDDYVKSRIHILSHTQSPTGKGVVYLGKLGLSGGMEQDEAEDDTSSLLSLHQAVRAGNLATVKNLLEANNADVNATNDEGKAALHLAAETGCLELVKYLVGKNNIGVNATDVEGRTALHLAAEKGYLEVIKCLVEEKNADINATDNEGKAAIHLAAETNRLEVIKYLVGENNFDVDTSDDEGKTALHLAAEKGHLAIVKYLAVETNTDVNAIDNEINTALHLAAKAGHLEVVKCLVEEKRADVNAQDVSDGTALHLAAEAGHLAIIKYLVEEKEANVNAYDNDNKIALHFAASGGHLAIITYLIEEQGSNVNARNEDGGFTALHLAAEAGHLDAVKYFIEERGVDVNNRDNFGRTVLHCAAEKGHLQVVEYVLEEQATNVNIRDDFDRTALHHATEEGYLEIVKYLLEEGDADVEARDQAGNTVLHYAAENGNLTILKYLAEERRANVNARNNHGTTALHWAAQGGYLEVISYLMEEASGFHNHQIIRDPEHYCFNLWENMKLYAQLATLADVLYSREDSQTFSSEEISTITDASLKLKLAYKGQVHRPRQECPHDLVTAFRNRFNQRIRKEGVPEAMILNPKEYFKNIQLPDSLETERQAFINLINASKETYLLHASSLVALLEKSEEISSAPLSFILCPPDNFRPYDPGDLVQRRTVEFYTQRSAKLARLVENVENVNRDLPSAEIEEALYTYLGTYFLQLEPHTELIEAVQEDKTRKNLIVNQIESMLIEDEVLLPVGAREKLVRLLEAL